MTILNDVARIIYIDELIGSERPITKQRERREQKPNAQWERSKVRVQGWWLGAPGIEASRVLISSICFWSAFGAGEISFASSR